MFLMEGVDGFGVDQIFGGIVVYGVWVVEKQFIKDFDLVGGECDFVVCKCLVYFGYYVGQVDGVGLG